MRLLLVYLRWSLWLNLLLLDDEVLSVTLLSTLFVLQSIVATLSGCCNIVKSGVVSNDGNVCCWDMQQLFCWMENSSSPFVKTSSEVMLQMSNKKMMFHSFFIPAKVWKKALGCTPKALFSLFCCVCYKKISCVKMYIGSRIMSEKRIIYPKKLGILIPLCSAIALTIKLGPLPM